MARKVQLMSLHSEEHEPTHEEGPAKSSQCRLAQFAQTSLLVLAPATCGKLTPHIAAASQVPTS